MKCALEGAQKLLSRPVAEVVFIGHIRVIVIERPIHKMKILVILVANYKFQMFREKEI